MGPKLGTLRRNTARAINCALESTCLGALGSRGRRSGARRRQNDRRRFSRKRIHGDKKSHIILRFPLTPPGLPLRAIGAKQVESSAKSARGAKLRSILAAKLRLLSLASAGAGQAPGRTRPKTGRFSPGYSVARATAPDNPLLWPQLPVGVDLAEYGGRQKKDTIF